MITFNGHTESDIPGLRVLERTITTPSKKKNKSSIPFMNSAYDFSTIGSGGDNVYEQRPIKVKFGIVASSKPR